MQVRVTGKQIDLGAALPEAVRTRLASAVAKHFEGGGEAHVVFSHEGTFFRADVATHLDSGAVLKSEGEGADAYRAFGVALERLEIQIHKHVQKLKNHHT